MNIIKNFDGAEFPQNIASLNGSVSLRRTVTVENLDVASPNVTSDTYINEIEPDFYLGDYGSMTCTFRYEGSEAGCDLSRSETKSFYLRRIKDELTQPGSENEGEETPGEDTEEHGPVLKTVKYMAVEITDTDIYTFKRVPVQQLFLHRENNDDPASFYPEKRYFRLLIDICKVNNAIVSKLRSITQLDSGEAVGSAEAEIATFGDEKVLLMIPSVALENYI